jgi:translation initiation factor IF-3
MSGRPDTRRPVIHDRGPRINQQIRIRQVRVIDEENKQLGIMETADALALALHKQLDLVEIAPNQRPPVCRIMDFGKYKFDLQKKANLQKKKTKQQEIKELKFRPTTDEGDYLIKLRNLRRFIAEGDKVKVNIRFKGREMAHTELGLAMARKIETDIKDEVIIEQWPRLEGRQMIMMVAPKKK